MLESSLIIGIDLVNATHTRKLVASHQIEIASILRRADEFVLSFAYSVGNHTWTIDLIVESHLVNDGLDE